MTKCARVTLCTVNAMKVQLIIPPINTKRQQMCAVKVFASDKKTKRHANLAAIGLVILKAAIVHRLLLQKLIFPRY